MNMSHTKYGCNMFSKVNLSLKLVALHHRSKGRRDICSFIPNSFGYFPELQLRNEGAQVKCLSTASVNPAYRLPSAAVMLYRQICTFL